MGGTKILAAVINSKEGIIARVKKPTPAGAKPGALIKALAEVVNQIITEAGLKLKNIKAVSLGIPGSLNPFTGRVGLAPNLGLKNFFIKDQLEKLVNIPVLIENDVNLGALGIKEFGVGKNKKNMLVVFVGTGIGGALIFDGKIYRGSSFTAGEIGHIVIDKNGLKCGCGNYGCFETVASRLAIVRNIKLDIKAKKKTIITKISGKNKPIKSKALAAAVKANDKVVVKRVSDACEVIGTTLASLTNLLNVDEVVLGGGLIEALGNFMTLKIRTAFNQNLLAETAKAVKLVPSKLGDDAALYGGIVLAEEFLGLKV
ncbi:MAG TPA: ROK family protein [Ignavibacteriaceae bacterium]|nr:ROK family protein [Ignavibacteriaceae bacterium]